MKNCNHCNAVLSDDTVQCPYCGMRIKSNTTFNQQRKPQQRTYSNEPVGQNGSTSGKFSIVKIFLFVVYGIPFIMMLLVFMAFAFIGFAGNVVNSTVEKTAEGGIIQEDGSVVFSHELTVNKVIELSEQGYNLSWEHFGIYDFVEHKYDEKTGYQLIRYKIEEDCVTRYLVITGIKGEKPEEILFYESRDGFKVDIRDTKAFERFRNTHLRSSGCW